MNTSWARRRKGGRPPSGLCAPHTWSGICSGASPLPLGQMQACCRSGNQCALVWLLHACYIRLRSCILHSLTSGACLMTRDAHPCLCHVQVAQAL